MVTIDEGPINKGVDEIFRLDRFIDMAATGFQFSVSAEEAVRLHNQFLIAQGEGLKDDDPAFIRKLESARAVQGAAMAELSTGLSYLYELAIVKLWSVLEAMIDDCVFRLLHVREEWQRSETLRSIKGPLVEFMFATEPEQAAHLMAQLKESTKADLKIGVGRFEVLLDVVGIAGPVDNHVRRALLELSQVRHLLVHRVGIIDKRFIDACPWLRLSVGQTLYMGKSHYNLYSTACLWYLRELSRRVRAKNGKAPLSESAETLTTLARKIEAFEKSREAGRNEARE